MPIEQVACVNFDALSVQEHDEALALYSSAVRHQAHLLAGLLPGTPAHEACLDKLACLLSLRRAHQLRRQEIGKDELFANDEWSPGSRLASKQYLENQRPPHCMA